MTPIVGLASGPGLSIVMLAATDAAHAPIRNLPSIAMLSMPDALGQDAGEGAERDRRGEVRGSRRGRPSCWRSCRRAAPPGSADDPERDRRSASVRRHWNAAPRISCSMPDDAGDDTGRGSRAAPTVVGDRERRAALACRSRTRTSRACPSSGSRAGSANRPRAARMAPRIRAARRARALGGAELGTDRARRSGLAAVMPRPLRSWRAASGPSPWRPASRRSGTASG